MRKVFSTHNYFLLFIMAASIVLVGSKPQPAQAQTGSLVRSEGSLEKQANMSLDSSRLSVANDFCINIPTLATSINQEVSSRIEKMLASQSVVGQELNRKSIERQNKTLAQRQQWDKNREAQYDSLYKNAKNDEQKLAVDSFKNEVEKAVLLRRLANQKSMNEFELTIDNYLFSEKNKLALATSNYQKNLILATSKAVRECSTASGQSNARPELISTLTQSQAYIKNGSAENITIQAQIDEIASRKRESIKEANLVFDQKISKAKADFDQTFEK
jgi:hypothetical protein